MTEGHMITLETLPQVKEMKTTASLLDYVSFKNYKMIAIDLSKSKH